MSLALAALHLSRPRLQFLIENKVCIVLLVAGPWEHAIALAVGGFVGYKVGQFNEVCTLAMSWRRCCRCSMPLHLHLSL
jgi:hypothetical protein